MPVDILLKPGDFVKCTKGDIKAKILKRGAKYRVAVVVRDGLDHQCVNTDIIDGKEIRTKTKDRIQGLILIPQSPKMVFPTVWGAWRFDPWDTVEKPAGQVADHTLTEGAQQEGGDETNEAPDDDAPEGAVLDK